MTYLSILSLLLSVYFVAASTSKMESLKHPEAVEKLSQSNDRFTANLQSSLGKNNEGKNMVVSGLSLSSVLAMVSTGAEGKTLKEIQDICKFPEDTTDLLKGYSDVLSLSKSNENFTLDLANSVFVHEDYKLLDDFQQKMEKHFHANPKNLNFGQEEKSRNEINQWVKEKTKEKISELFPIGVINSQTRLVLVNAIYFKGDWAKKFNKKLTEKRDFFISPENKIQVDTMYSEDIKFGLDYNEDLGAKILEMPYKGNRISMFIVFPDSESSKIEKLEEKLKNFDMRKLLTRRQVKLELSIPKFKIESKHDLVDTLKDMGMNSMFDSKEADFSGISGTKDLFVSNVVQKAVIEVNEEGSEAAAATGMVMMMRSMPLSPESLHINRPFVFMIKDKLTGFILFSGKVTNPNE